MNLNISVTSTKETAASGDLNRKLAGHGYSVETIAGRRWATKSLMNPAKLLNDATHIWHKRPFISQDGTGGGAEVIKIRFSGVKCQTVCSYSMGHTDRVIMVNPDDPIHSRLFHFRLVVDLPRSITLVVDKPQITFENFDCFVRVLQICLREFSTERKAVQFLCRKKIGWAKRRYLSWLNREGKLPPELKKLANNYPKPREVGLLKKADTIWEQMVEAEKALQQGL